MARKSLDPQKIFHDEVYQFDFITFYIYLSLGRRVTGISQSSYQKLERVQNMFPGI